MTVSTAGLLSWLNVANQSRTANVSFDHTTDGSSINGTAPTYNTYHQVTSPGSVTGFTCVITVPYNFANTNNNESLAVMYSVSASDGAPCLKTAGYCPFPPTFPGGSQRQVLQIALPPQNGGIVNVSQNVTL